MFGDEPLAEAGVALEAFYRLFDRYAKITGSTVYELAINTKRGTFTPPTSKHAIVTEVVELRNAFLSKMDDDFNTGGAVSDLFEMVRAMNRLIDAEKLEETVTETAKIALQECMSILRELSAILGLFKKPPRKQSGGDESTQTVEELMQLIIKLRAEARAKKDFAAADMIRDGLGALKIQLLDKKGETVWERTK